MELRWPTVELLDSYVAALRRGWSPDTMRPEAGEEELAAIAASPDAFVASLVDRDGSGPPVRRSDGSFGRRVPGYRKWMWAGEIVGSIGLRWVPGTDELPLRVPGHIGYGVVPWQRRRGWATTALGLILDEARDEGLHTVELTTDHDNVASQRVIERNGGVAVGTFTKQGATGPIESVRYRIDLSAGSPTVESTAIERRADLDDRVAQHRHDPVDVVAVDHERR